MLKRSDVCKVTGLCYTTIYNLEKKGQFPARRKLSPGRVAWVYDEIVSWLEELAKMDQSRELEIINPVVSISEPKTHRASRKRSKLLSPLTNISEPNRFAPETACTEKPISNRSRFEPWPWLR